MGDANIPHTDTCDTDTPDTTYSPFPRDRRGSYLPPKPIIGPLNYFEQNGYLKILIG